MAKRKKAKGKQKWWISWYGCFAKLGEFELYTPWWVSGVTCEEPERQTIVAAIWADGEGEIKEIIYNCYDKRPEPGEIEFRFMEPCSVDWDPRENKNGRFPFAKWMEPYWQRGEYRQEEHI